MFPSAASAGASPGADAMVGSGALLFPLVVLGLVIVGIVAAAARSKAAAVVSMSAGILAGGTAIGDLSRSSSAFDGLLIAWMVAGVFAIACGAYGLHAARQRKRVLDQS